MSESLNRRLAKMVRSDLKEMAEDFADEIERPPTLGELLELLTYGVQSSREAYLKDVRPQDASLKAKLDDTQEGGKKRRASAVDELNDNVFVLANGLWSDLAHAYIGETGEQPELKRLLAILVEALHQSKQDLLSDVNPASVNAIEAKTKKPPKATAHPGDVVAIPGPDRQFYLAVVVDKNDFGTAFGLFKGARPAAMISKADHPPVIRHPIYSDDTLVEKGKWKILGHDEELLALFPKHPEVFHSSDSEPEGRKIGRYGAASSVSGEFRDLTREEAKEVGLLDDTYSQYYLPEHVSDYLSERYS